MTRLVLLFVGLLFMGQAFSQQCNDLIISEVVFGNKGKGKFNHSVELFNPTDQTIDLAYYSLALVAEDEGKSHVSLSGSLASGEAYVISNTSSDQAIAALSNTLDATLLFNERVAIELTKEGIVIDKIGRQGVAATAEVIDLEKLLNDPEYFNSLDINLGSIENLLVRRSKLVKTGKSDFYNTDLLDYWAIYPEFAIDHLGQHTSACMNPIIFWDGVSAIEPDAERWEWDIAPVNAVLKSSEELSDNIVIFVADWFSNFPPFPPSALAGFDYTTGVDVLEDIPFPAQTDELGFELMTVINDQDMEGDEGTGFLADVAEDPNNTGAEMDFSRDLFDVLILDNETSSTDQVRLSKTISTFPTIVDHSLTIQSADQSLSIEEVRLVGIEAKTFARYEGNRTNQMTLDLSAYASSGYRVVIIKTDQGMVTKKVFKMN